MSHIRKGSSASSPGLRNINVTSGIPLSDISNVDICSNTDKPEAVQRTKARRIYSNSKRFNTTSSQTQSTLNYSTHNNKENLSSSTSTMYNRSFCSRGININFSSALSYSEIHNTNLPFSTYPSHDISNVSIRNVDKDEAAKRRKARRIYLNSKRLNKNSTQTQSTLTSYTTNKENISPNTTFTLNRSSFSVLSSINVSSGSSKFNSGNIASSSGIPRNITSNSASDMVPSSSSTIPPNTVIASDEPSPLIRMSSGKRKLVRKRRNLTHIPIIDLTTDDDNEFADIIDQHLKGVSKDYLDHGDQIIVCRTCSAKLWKAEADRGEQKRNKPNYFLCCSYSKVLLPDFKQPPEILKDLYVGVSAKSKFFLKNIRRYNSMFSFTSMGGRIDKTINRGNAPYVFRLSGQNYHTIGSLLPEDGNEPKFSQLYIYDTDNEIFNRQNAVGGSNTSFTITESAFDVQIIEELTLMLDTNNALVKIYRQARNFLNENPYIDLKLCLIGKRSKDGRTYNLPEASEVVALVIGDLTQAVENRDIVVKRRSGRIERISELHPSYLSLQYPLLFPYGEDMYRVDILHRGLNPDTNSKRPMCTMREFFAYRLQDRVDKFSLIHNAKRLFQQFVVDAYTMIESERLFYIRRQQTHLRSETVQNIQNASNAGKKDMSKIGTRIFIPSSFTGGSRYMMQNYLDAMSLCKWFGYRDEHMPPNTDPVPIPIPIDSITKELKEAKLLGRVNSVVYTVEFQKCGLPHAHICVFMHPDSKILSVDQLDPIISAEIPDIAEDPELYKLVADYMIHGPCGPLNMNCPCMIDRKCSKKFPKKFVNETCLDKKGFPVYRRRDSGLSVVKSRVNVDNRYVVPYSKVLLKRYQAHINVEGCNQVGSIKYLFKYINKGPDRTTLRVVESGNQDEQEPVVDEIEKYYDCRYISACESVWRIFSYDIHYRYPAVIRLPFHLPGQQNVVYGADDDIDEVLNKPSVASTMFLSWMKCNEKLPEARNLTYVEFPSKFVFKLRTRSWDIRKRHPSIGRIHSVFPSAGEAYYLRILLNKVKGPKSFEDIRTVNGTLYPTFRDACYALGLLDDDNEYIEAIKEANLYGSATYLRTLFGTMLMSGSLSRPDFVWEKTWTYLSDDILYRQEKHLNVDDLNYSDEEIKNLALLEIEKFLLRNNSSLRNYSNMPYPDDESISSSNNRLINEELSYFQYTMEDELNNMLLLLTDEQHNVFDQIMESVRTNKGGVFFVYGYGGTGKTFLWKTLSAAIRSKSEIVLNVASSGIASLLLSGGRTAHSRFSIPLNLNEDSLCRMKPGSELACLLKKTQLIIWDEAPMIHKHAFEALDRTLKDILMPDCSNSEALPFGGKVIVFGGDFRQILPVVPNGSRQDIVNASLSSSYIWNKCKLLTLTKNMRLTVGMNHGDIDKTKEFAKWLLDIGEGKLGGRNDGEAVIDIPQELLITESTNPIGNLINFVYPSILESFNDPNYFQERAILAPKNDVVHEINDTLLAMFPGDHKEYLSSDSICQSESKNGLCNGTRLQVVKLGDRIIEAKVISGNNIGTRTFIPRINLSPSDKRIPFKLQRRQFPIAVCFAMTINKSQGQSLSKVGLFLKQPVFTHGQLYVAVSRVKSMDGLRMLILDVEGNVTNKTTNVVYKEIFSNL
ncbi:uncharacterized protein LOC110923677 [Helianthus annuus]|uniref:uncharacterized protein LOC110923677 n=1 Tax=Helianthus annuus TaxID=4232 RepID=UPI001652DBE2|nr:uncharacterized protein LOC110923677 [Helianthus annuus]